jgi:hypothetical protein
MHWLLLGFLLLGAFGVEVGVGRTADAQDTETLYGGTGFPPSRTGQATTLYGGTGFPPTR